MLKIIFRISLFLLLTILTQIGGVVLLLSLSLHKFIDGKVYSRFLRSITKILAFILLYFIFTFSLVPITAKYFGRVRMPITEQHHLKPLNVLTCLLNRNYVRPELRNVAFDAADKMHEGASDVVVSYLDANFPFINRIPLFPHLSHNDGKKLDLAFCYLWNSKHSEISNSSPSWIGYGVSVEPEDGEENKCEFCEKYGYWQYGLLNKIISQSQKSKFLFDASATKRLVKLFADDTRVEKIFIEPHLKKRLGLETCDKIRFQGCHSVRHDDHIHVQIK